MSRRWLALVLTPLVLAGGVLGCARIVSKLRGDRDSGFQGEPKDPDAAIARYEGGLGALHIGDLFDDDEGDDAIDAGCPREIHPGYCRRRCRDLEDRQRSHHARRVSPSAEYALGTCGRYQVFAERTPDAGGIVEYYDPDGGELVGAIDDRRKSCGRYGAIPTCAPKLDWKRSRPTGLSALGTE